MCLFAVTVYLRAWFTAPLAARAPQNDLKLLKDLYNYRQVNEAISKATCKKLEGHLWYLCEQLVGLAFFDDDVTSTTKRKMVAALKMNDESHNTSKAAKRITLSATEASSKELEDFVTGKTSELFAKLRVSTDFFNVDPEVWQSRDGYKRCLGIINKLHVTNDNAERGIALVQELNKRITYDEEQFQFLLQVVVEHRRKYSCRKFSLE